MALLTQSGRTALAVSLKAQPLHLAWGTGDSAWESTFTQAFTFQDEQIQLPQAPLKSVSLADASEGYDVDLEKGVISRTLSSVPNEVTVTYTVATATESIVASQLINEVGRRAVDEVTYCVGDEEGLLVTPTGRFTASGTPTNQLYMHATFDFEDAANETILLAHSKLISASFLIQNKDVLYKAVDWGQIANRSEILAKITSIFPEYQNKPVWVLIISRTSTSLITDDLFIQLMETLDRELQSNPDCLHLIVFQEGFFKYKDPLNQDQSNCLHRELLNLVRTLPKFTNLRQLFKKS